MSIHDFGSAAARGASQAARRVLPAAFTALVAAMGSPPVGAVDRELVGRGNTW